MKYNNILNILNMTSKQNTKEKTNMSFQESTAQITINEGCLEYIFYVPSLWRINCNVTLPFGDLLMENEKELCRKAEVVNIDMKDYNINPLPLLRELLPKKYNDIIAPICESANPNWYFMGCSDSGIVSFLQNPSSVWSIEQYLKGVLPRAKLVKIVFTAALGEKDTPICLPYQCFNGEYQKFRYEPSMTLENDDDTLMPIAVIDCDDQWDSFKFHQKDRRSRNISQEVG